MCVCPTANCTEEKKDMHGDGDRPIDRLSSSEGSEVASAKRKGRTAWPYMHGPAPTDFCQPEESTTTCMCSVIVIMLHYAITWVLPPIQN